MSPLLRPLAAASAFSSRTPRFCLISCLQIQNKRVHSTQTHPSSVSPSNSQHDAAPPPNPPPPSFSSKMQPYLQLARLDKPIGTWLLYWPCAWSLTLAATEAQLPPSVLGWNLGLFGVGALVMRGAGCTINDMWDRKIDNQVERTKARPIASGDVSMPQAWTFLAGQLSLGLAVLTQLNIQSILFGACSLSLVAIYPLMKRVTYWPQAVLGLTFNYGALLGPVALLAYLPVAYLPLYAGTVAWTILYDTIYAFQDRSDDKLIGVKSTALLFGENKSILAGFAATFTAALGSTGWMLGAGPGFWLGTAGAAAHMAWQISSMQFNNRERCWELFKSNRNLGAILWSGFALDYLMMLLL